MKLKMILAAGVIILSGALSAQTPDGDTPANEGICDPLKASDVSKGLYGLCVAFCESQDRASLSDPITEAELEALQRQAPSGRILENYYRKAQPSDPDMPCIRLEEPCPCWTSEEFNDAVGVVYPHLRCHRYIGPVHNGSYIYTYDPNDPANTFANLFVVDHEHGTGDVGRLATCMYERWDYYHFFEITPEEWASCDNQIRNQMEILGLICTESSG